ncbi:hypothetical protein [Nonomuraea cavernae]|uniref:Uncharacterized protein n=1 Tax=Nonomuraea cavernae TaxID=2045107 RepID=A0A917YR29_9ACTN|nr:hypothetical protein [Nonomuraea cavernae]MCA2183577.1 hypothetical protein [Nonomuraea cavernae]GGO60722.1 hypothetical protein GCM10012289_01260 [Nonomuraea cavernae]
MLAIIWLATTLDLYNFLTTDIGYLYLHEVIGMPTSLVGLLWMGAPPTGFVVALLCGRKVAILFGLAIAAVGIRILPTIASLFFWA